ncbi:YJU2-like protein [Mya arenaria]|uniref:Splicing factor YJU2 n=1 Tax=Mya arenaria TaxID=6604 RepID=A0ABY7EDU5_MYAAR|nr:splicing factor YJU2-like [Mya arenaria]WAR07269.1 YJU2-like protein [Mya arenaria]
MSERKVLNKYYPADYDPSKIPKGKRNRNATFNIRIMAPFNMRCNMCKEYIYKGKKFNSRKEDVMDEDYLGLRIFRFYIKCPRCVSEIAFKTDLVNTDYTLEAGAKRLFEAEKIAKDMAEKERKAKEEEELNPMTMLENRTKASQKEMDQIDSLEELREMNTRKNLVNTDEMIDTYRRYEKLLAQLQMEQEEQEIKDIFGGKDGLVVKRLNDSDEEEDQPRKKHATLSSTDKPTDILTEPAKPESKQKTPQVWQKSVGSLSSKQKLAGLVTVKKKAPLPTVSASPANPSGAVANIANSDYSTSSTDSNVHVTTRDNVTSEISNSERTVVNGSSATDAASTNTVKASSSTSRTDVSASGSGVKTATGAMGLGLLGAYGGLDSDSSESD